MPNPRRRDLSVASSLTVGSLCTALAAWVPGPHADAAALEAPCASSIATRISTTRDDYHGVAVDDPYRWLEDDSNDEVRAWSKAQAGCARRYLDGLADALKIRARLTQLMSGAHGMTYVNPRFGGARLFMLQNRSNAQQPSLVWFGDTKALSAPRVVLDLMSFDPTGSTSVDWYVPSADGRMVAVSLSQGGTERGTLYVFDAATGRRLDDAPIENVNNATAGGDLAWSPDGKGFFYTRYPQRGERPDAELAFHQRVYYHLLGARPNADRYELGNDLPPIAAIRLRVQRESGRIIAWVQNGDSGQFRFFLRETDGRWRPFGDFSDGHFEAEFGQADDIFLLTTRDAPRGRVLRLSARDLDVSRAPTVVGESTAVLSHSFYRKDSPTVVFGEGKLLLTYQNGGPTELRIFATSGERLPGPQLPTISHVTSVTMLTGHEALFAVESFATPREWRRLELGTRTITGVLSDAAGIAPWKDASVTREFAVSRDGTRVPVTIIRMRGTKTRGLLLTGYGGYRIAVTPHFEPEVRLLLEQGIAYAVANLRGGSEFGEDWHRQGSLTQKQRVFDDFIAVAEHLLERGYAPRGKLAITGTSNGGLLMGAVVTQRPQLAQAVVSRVGIYDSLRNELDENGVFNIPEFGTVKDERQFRVLLAYSPYHNVPSAERYPPTLFMTGANDSRVDPMHSRKMVARMQAANRSATPILLRTSDSTGHGAGTPLSARIEELTDAYAFIMQAVGISYQPPTKSAKNPAPSAPAR